MQSLTKWFINEVVPAFSRTLVHSFWIGILAAVLAAIVIVLTRKRTANLRYNGLLAVYLIFLLSTIGFFLLEMKATVGSGNHSVTPANAGTAIVVIENASVQAKAIEQNLGTTILSFVNRNAVLFFALWSLLFAIHLTRMSFGLRYIKTIRKKGTSDVSTEWKTWIDAACLQLGINKNVLLLESEAIKVPVALGFLKPVVLVPIGLLSQLPASQVEAILLHELAHIRRHDYLVNLLQSFADAVFFFNPAARWISAQIREARETCCDEKAVQYTANKKGYVEALVSFSQWPSSPAYTMAIGGNKTHLLNRVKTIITRENSRLTKREQATLVVGMLVMLSFGVFAFKPKEKEAGPQPVIEKKLPVVMQDTASVELEKPVIKKARKAVTKLRVDTIPVPLQKGTEPKKWRNLITNITDDGEGKTTQVIATDENGTVYRLRKINGQIVLLTVNDREVPKENYAQYQSAINSIEEARNKSAKNAALKREQKALEAKQKQIFWLDKQEALTRKQAEVQKHVVAIKKNKMAYWKDSLNQQKQLNQHKQKMQLHNEKMQLHNQKMKLHNQKAEMHQKRKVSQHNQPNIAAIISDLMANRLAENETKISFSLTDNELIVNGKAADKNTFELFRKKYIRSSGDKYIYSRDGGNISTTVNIQ